MALVCLARGQVKEECHVSMQCRIIVGRDGRGKICRLVKRMVTM